RPAKAAPKPPPLTKTVPEDQARAATADADDSLMALPIFRSMPWLRWALPLAAVVLLGVLGVFLWNTLNPGDNRVASRGNGTDGSHPDDRDKPDYKRKTETKKTDEKPKQDDRTK